MKDAFHMESSQTTPPPSSEAKPPEQNPPESKPLPVAATPPPHRWTLFFSLFAILVSSASLIISWANYSQTKRVNHFYVKPDVVVAVRHNTLPQWTNAPWSAELAVLNKGPIKAASVFVKYTTWLVNTNVWWPEGAMGVLSPLQFNYVFKLPELEVGDGKVKSILGAAPIAIFEVELSYYHPNDMTKYSQRVLFFYESGEFYDEPGFKQKPYYSILMKNLQNRLTNKKAEFLPGRSKPSAGEINMHPCDIFIPDDRELPRPLE
jgi:hypothetical protein